MSINFRYTDHDFDGFIFGQMTMTGYKKIIILERDYPEHGWKEGDMIVVNENDSPCFRIEPLFGTKTETKNLSNSKTVKKYKGRIIVKEISEDSETP